MLASRLLKGLAAKWEMETVLMVAQYETYKAGGATTTPDRVEAVMTATGPVKVDDIPRNDAGEIDQEWLAANCLCASHAADRKEGGNYGQYL